MNAVAISVVVVLPDKYQKGVCLRVRAWNVCVHVFVLVLANSKENFKCQMGYRSELPIGPLPSVSTRPDTMETARTGEKQLEHRLACFFLKRECVCGWGICITDEYRPGWCETVSSQGAQGEMQRPRWETLQSYLPSCLPLRLRPSLSTLLFPLSEYAPIFPHHHFSTLFYHILPTSPPALPYTLATSLHFIFPLHPP